MASTNKDKLKELLGKIAVSTNTITVEDDINHYTILELLNALRSNVKEINKILDNLDDEIKEEVQRLIDNGTLDHLIADEALINLYSANLSQTQEMGSCALLVFHKKFTILFDCGYTGQEQAIRAFLESKGVTRLDVVIVSHFHADHSGCFKYIAENYCDKNTLFFRQIECDWSRLTAEGSEARQQEEKYISTLVELGYYNNSKIPTQNEIINLNNDMIKLRFLNADNSFASSYYTTFSDTDLNSYTKSSLNNFSLICEVTAFGKKILLTGDVEQQAQINNAEFIEKCDVMQIPHHNWNHNGYYKFFDHACPEITFYNRNTQLNDPFVYWAKYQRQSRGYVPTYYTLNQHVEIEFSKNGIDVISGAQDTTFYVDESTRQFVEYIPYCTDTSFLYWDFANWSIKDVIKMIRDVPNVISVPLFTNSRYTKFLDELKSMTGLETGLIVTSNSRGLEIKRASNWDGSIYNFNQYFDFEQPSSYAIGYYETRTNFTNNSENTNMNLSVGESKALEQDVRSPQKLLARVKSIRDGATSIYTIPIFKQPNTSSIYLTDDIQLSAIDENRYLRIIKCSLTIRDKVVTLEECKLYVYNLLNNTLQEYECTLDGLRCES